MLQKPSPLHRLQKAQVEHSRPNTTPRERQTNEIVPVDFVGFGVGPTLFLRFVVELAPSQVDRFSDLDLLHLLEIPKPLVHGRRFLGIACHDISISGLAKNSGQQKHSVSV
jgi:hypothetical protein